MHQHSSMYHVDTVLTLETLQALEIVKFWWSQRMQLLWGSLVCWSTFIMRCISWCGHYDILLGCNCLDAAQNDNQALTFCAFTYHIWSKYILPSETAHRLGEMKMRLKAQPLDGKGSGVALKTVPPLLCASPKYMSFTSNILSTGSIYKICLLINRKFIHFMIALTETRVSMSTWNSFCFYLDRSQSAIKNGYWLYLQDTEFNINWSFLLWDHFKVCLWVSSLCPTFTETSTWRKEI